MGVLHSIPLHPAPQQRGLPSARQSRTPREHIADVVPLRATAPQPISLMRDLKALFRRLEAVDTRRFESCTTETIAREHIPEVTELLTDIRATLAVVAARYEGSAKRRSDSARPDDFDIHVDALMHAADTATRVADIAIIARMELAHRHERLRRLPANASSWDVIAVTSSIRRRALKSVTALRQALCEHERLDCENLWFRTELEDSLEVRREYAAFRRRLGLGRPPSRDEMYARLRLVGTSLAMLIGASVYEHLRVTDRRLLRALQEKVIQWLRVDPSSSGRFPARAGERIWQDLAASADLLMQVNQRAELREHDAAALQRLADELRTAQVNAAVSPKTLARLRALEGADPALDELILERAGTRITTSALRPIVTRLLAAAQRPAW